MRPDVFEITGIGSQGDGIAQTPAGPVFVPFALPGERARVAADGTTELLSPPTLQRETPLCRHFGSCGGCVAQHMAAQIYAEWKRGIVTEAFRRRGLTPTVSEMMRLPARSRRRATFTARQEGGVLQLGYHQRRSRRLIAIEECPVLLPAIAGNLPALRAIAATLQATEAHITVLATPAGLDVSAECRPTRRDARVVGRLAQLAGGHGIARISLNGEVIVERARPSLAFAGAVVTPPPGAFVQATAEGEAALSALVADAVAGAKRIADLFCGIGTLTFPLARLAPVLAVDCEQPALAALAAAAKATQGLKPIETCVRDLFREPLSVKELAGWEAIVLDPPHAGASAQVEQIAHCGASSVVYVSCNPATLARDARLLVDAGYRIAGVTPIDQFVFAADVEVVAVLNRDTRPSHGTKRPTRRA